MSELQKWLTHAVEDGETRFDFPEESVIWSVNGGVLAAAMLHAARSVSTLDRPANLSCQFVKPVKPGPAVACAKIMARGSRADLVHVELHQSEQRAAFGQVWIGAAIDGPEERPARMPHAPHPLELRPLEEVLGPGETHIAPRFWAIMDERPINRIGHTERRHRGPRVLRWFRYHESFPADPFWAATPVLPIMDAWGVMASHFGTDEALRKAFAPTSQLSVQFTDLAADQEWLLCDASCDAAGAGLVSSRLQMWSATGKLIAQGLSQAFVRPWPGGVQAKA